MQKNSLKGYDEEKKTGSIRHIVAREIGGKFIVTLVTTTKTLRGLSAFVESLSALFPEFSLYLNINVKDTNVIFGEEFILVHGMGFFDAEEQGIRYEAGPVTFLQVNENVRGKLYSAAKAAVAQEGDEVVVDAYSGGGLLTAMLAKVCKRVYGIEIEEEAVRCADSLKAKNGLENMTNICGRVEDKIEGVLQAEKGEKLRLILDPPRAGIARSVLNAILQSGIPKIAIISCNPATLARDVGILTGSLIEQDGALVKNPAYASVNLSKTDDSSMSEEVSKEEDNCPQHENQGTLNGFYQIEVIQPFDMFPETRHVETLVSLSRK
jgi:23S rRNA (uracil1939-C5)-methyltransferase